MLVDPDLVAVAGGPAALDFRRVTTVEQAHGRLEERTLTVSSLVQEPSDWPSLAQAVRLDYRHTDLSTGKISTEVRSGITSQPSEVADPTRLLAQVCREQAPHVLATVNTTVIGLVFTHGYANLAHARRTFNYLVDTYLHQLCLSWST
jgi:hypothetical protein